MQCPGCGEIVSAQAGNLAIGVTVPSTEGDHIARLERELAEAREYQSAISEVLGVISRTRGKVQRVLDTIAQIAERLCAGDRAQIFTERDGKFQLAAYSNTTDEIVAHFRANPFQPSRETATARAVLEGRTIHVPDVTADPEYDSTGFHSLLGGSRLAVPLLSAGRTTGVIAIPRKVAAPFTQRQIDLVTTFADQAVIAIENARLFEAEQKRTRELAEALEYQTATSDVLSVISKSPGGLEPVFQAMLDNAVRVCGASFGNLLLYDGEKFRHVALHNAPRGWAAEQEREPVPPRDLARVLYRVPETKRRVHIADLMTVNPDEPIATKAGARTLLLVPMLKQDELVGVIALYRQEVRPFTEKQIEVVDGFAKQAVIAIENARLLDELTTRQKELEARTKELAELLEYQTATSGVLNVIARAPGELQPVLHAIAAKASKLCSSAMSNIQLYDGEKLSVAAMHNFTPEADARFQVLYPMRPDPVRISGRAVLTGSIVHVPDVLADPDYPADLARAGNWRAILAVPMLKEGKPIGVINVGQSEPGLFSERQVDLLRTFANQAVIAIENARLLDELQTRQRELTEALEYQTATSKILCVISSSLGNVKPVFEAILESSRMMSEAEFGHLLMFNGETWSGAALQNLPPAYADFWSAAPVVAGPESLLGRIAQTNQAYQLADAQLGPGYQARTALAIATIELGLARTLCGVPLLKDGQVIGAIVLYRKEVRPFEDKQIALLSSFADQAVIAIENARLLDELQTRQKDLARSVEELRSLGEVGQAVNSTLDVGKVLQTVLENACRMANAGGGTVYAYDTASGEFRVEAGYNMSEEHIARVRAHPMRLGDRVVGECAERREAVQVEDLARVESADVPLLDILARAGVRAVLAVPLVHQGEVVGALVIRRSYPGAFAPETVRLLEAFAAQSAIAVNNARLFAEIEEKGEQLRLASLHKSQFLANMSHELRTPLNAILGYTELMQDGIYGALPEKAGGVLGRVQTNGQHLLGLINAVLDLSKIEAGQLQLDIVEYGMPAVVEAVVVAAESLAIEKTLKLEANVAANLPRGLGDERRITQVLLNLVGNAIKFTEQGAVTINAELAGDRFLVSVADTGLGIPPAEQERVFEEFHQVDSSNTKAKGGTGLGLAIARRIIEMHGGRIWVESTPGQGATFRFELPVSAKQSEGDDEQAHTRH